VPELSSAKWGEVCEKGKKKQRASKGRVEWQQERFQDAESAEWGTRRVPALVPVQGSEYSALQRNVGRRSCCTATVVQRAVASGAKQRAALSLSGGIAKAASRKTAKGVELEKHCECSVWGCGRGIMACTSTA
jgi:hypothetical protein